MSDLENLPIFHSNNEPPVDHYGADFLQAFVYGSLSSQNEIDPAKTFGTLLGELVELASTDNCRPELESSLWEIYWGSRQFDIVFFKSQISLSRSLQNVEKMLL